MRRRNKVLIGIFITLLLLISGMALILEGRRTVTPLESYKQSANFPLYYPKANNDVLYEQNSASYNDGTLFYKIRASGYEITVTEQTLPKELSSFRLDGFNVIATDVGSMYVGTTGKNQTAIITTPTTLITITDSNSQNTSLVSDIGKDIKKLR